MNARGEYESCVPQSRAGALALPCGTGVDSPITMTGLYDSVRNRALATRCLSRIARSLEPEAEIHSEWWTLDAFHHTSSHTHVVDSSERSMVLWFAGDAQPDHVDILEEWLNDCHFQEGTPRALVTVLDMESTKYSILERIHIMAASHNLELFSSMESGSWTAERSNLSFTELMRPWPLHVPHALRPHQIRNQGINE